MKELDGFTVERLEEILNFDLPRHPAALEEIVALARIALAAKRAEPIYQYQSGVCMFDDIEWVWDDCDKGFYVQYDPTRRRIVYTTPQLNSPEIPEGWKLVPNMPTLGMLSVLGLTGSFESMLGRYADMLAAAPESE
ncbi:TPA: hypothetical protein ACY4ZU_004024 [Yersinia enterocolitica]|nr:hypothetical protein [Yersinia enterocolitica]EKN4899778.1 hypothetical protein [Yersinia enterocolitica]HDL6602101.1 hypothetical protein [Yersinia enterocolitica]HDW3131435.1 hypothetical protein [Yersinia enterocolitica]HEN3551585.1 hypothetical protein [Yersinia enterocolitica]